MFALSKARLVKEYLLFKKTAISFYKDGDIENSLRYVKMCARSAYDFSFVFTDEELELLLTEISLQVLPTNAFDAHKDRFVFYDYFGNDNRGLTQQYIRAMISWNVPFLYILENADTGTQSSDIVAEISAYTNAEILVLNAAGDIEKMRQAHMAITAYKPERAFLHFVPWDVIGVCIWNSLRQVRRFFIDLTDHTFWLGKSCADYFLEFRIYGCCLALEQRKIDRDKLLLQHYYPIQANEKFSGFPVDVRGKVTGFSGAAFYKIYGRQRKFLELIKDVLLKNDNFIFLLAGEGNSKPLLKFIKDNGFEKRFILLGNRSDINAVVANVDIFINTYPVSGGLIIQLAVLNRKALISYSTPDLPVNFIEEFLRVDRSATFTLKNENDFLAEMNRLISEPGYRKENNERYKNSIPSRDEFNERLNRNVYFPDENINFNIPNLNIDVDAITEVYLEIENEYLRQYDTLKLKHLGIQYLKFMPVAAIKSFLYSLIFNFRVYKAKLVRLF